MVKRAQQAHTTSRLYLFANEKGRPYAKSGWGSLWADAMFDWIASFDNEVATALAAKPEWEVRYRAAWKAKTMIEPYEGYKLAGHPAYFARRATGRNYNEAPEPKRQRLRLCRTCEPGDTHRNYDRRTQRRAKATE